MIMICVLPVRVKEQVLGSTILECNNIIFPLFRVTHDFSSCYEPVKNCTPSQMEIVFTMGVHNAFTYICSEGVDGKPQILKSL